MAPVVTTHSIILSSNKIQNGDMVPANQVHLEKWPLKWRDKQIAVKPVKPVKLRRDICGPCLKASGQVSGCSGPE